MAVQLQGSQGQVFGPAGTNHSQGLVPDPGSSADSSSTHRFLRSDATWDQVDYASITGTPVIPVIPATLTLLNTLTANNSATLSDTTSLTSTYSLYEIVFINIVPASNLVTFELQVHSGGAFKANTYLNATLFWTTAAAAETGSTTFIQLSSTNINNSDPGISGTVRIYNPSSTTVKKHVTGQMSSQAGGVSTGVTVAGYWNGGDGAVDGFQVQMSTGNMTSGTINVYGIP